MDIHELNFLFLSFYFASNYLQTIAHINEDLLGELSQKWTKNDGRNRQNSYCQFSISLDYIRYPIVCIRIRVHERNDAQMVAME